MAEPSETALRKALAHLAPLLWDRFQLRPWDYARLTPAELVAHLQVLVDEQAVDTGEDLGLGLSVDEVSSAA